MEDMNINLGSLQMPLNAATKTFALLAKRGAGKSYTGAVMAEEFYKAGIPFVVFDPIDVWWGLRLSADGKGRGLPIVVFGTHNADIQLDRDMGRRIAQAVVEKNVSCVISTFGLPKVAQRHLIAEFADELLNINNTPRHVFIEEAHEFVPQRVQGAMGKVFAAVESLVVMGRNRGIGVTLINQRAATLNKDVLTQLDTLLAFRNVAPQDRKALREWVEAKSADGDFNTFMASLPSLPTGEGWVWSPEFLDVFKRFTVRKRETFHPDREKLGDKFKMPEIDAVDVESFIAEFNVEAPKNIEKENLEVAVEQPQMKYTERINELESQLMQKDMLVNDLQKKLDTIRTLVGGAAVAPQINTPNVVTTESNLILQKLGGMPKNIYQRLLQHSSGLTKRQIALMCGYSVTSGSYSNALSKLTTMGLIKRDGEIYQALLK